MNPDEASLITLDTRFVGDMQTKSDIRIDGVFEGRLSSEARVVIGEKGVVKGEIFCNTADIYGSLLEGAVYVRDLLSVKSGANVQGKIYYKQLQIDLDAKVNGQCQLISEKEIEARNPFGKQ